MKYAHWKHEKRLRRIKKLDQEHMEILTLALLILEF